MDAYMFQAALLCEDCANRFMASHVKPDHVDTDDVSSYDSDEWPKGPYRYGGGEADTPQYCDHCGIFLENDLTLDGDKLLRDQASEFDTDSDMGWDEIARAAGEAGRPDLEDLIVFYFAWGQ